MLYAGLLQEQDLDSRTMSLVDKIGKQSEKLDFFMKELVRSSYAEQEMISIFPALQFPIRPVTLQGFLKSP